MFTLCVCCVYEYPAHFDLPLHAETSDADFLILLHSAACLSWLCICRFDHTDLSLPQWKSHRSLLFL